MTQPKPSLTPQTPLKSWCHSLESTSLLGCLGKMESVPVEERMSLQMECQLLDADPTTAQRLIRKSGGPFDIALPDVTMVGNHVTSVESDAISMTTEKDMDSEFDLYNLLQSGVQTDDLGESSHSMNDKNVDDFVDLFEFLLQNEKTNTVPAEELISEQPTTDNNNIIVGKKRTYETSSDSATVPSDHSGYTKVKRRHRVTVTSDSESDSGSTTQDMNDKEKHVLRRLKNNVASRRSRQTRKQKFVNMEKKAEELEIANAELRDRVTMLEHLAKEMKDNLIKCMTK